MRACSELKASDVALLAICSATMHLVILWHPSGMLSLATTSFRWSFGKEERPPATVCQPFGLRARDHWTAVRMPLVSTSALVLGPGTMTSMLVEMPMAAATA